MESSSSSSAQQGRALLLFMVVVGFIITFLMASSQGTVYTFGQLAWGILFGIAYAILGMFDGELLRSLPPAIRNVVYFSIQILLVFGIGWTLGPQGHWLIGLPLAGIAVDRLTPRGRIPVYFALVATIILPIGLRYSTWNAAFLNAFIISTAIAFVAVFSQFRLNEQKAREKAEALTRDLESANRRLALYASQAEELAFTKERNRLAREIHDNLGHYLTVVHVQIEAAKATLVSDPPRALDALEKAQDLAKKGLSSVRASVSTLRVSQIENRPLHEALRALIEETRATGLEMDLHILGEPTPIEPAAALTLYRAAQEGMTNIRKHADASRADITLDFARPDRISLEIHDNGKGAADTESGFGLIGIRERVYLLGGEFTIESQPGKGFHLKINVPLEGKKSE